MPACRDMGSSQLEVYTGMQVDGVLASIILDDFFDVGESMMKAEPAIQKLCKDFGIPSMDHVAIDTWPSEHFAEPFTAVSLTPKLGPPSPASTMLPPGLQGLV